MRTLVIGCNHRSAPVALREKLVFEPGQVVDALGALVGRFEKIEAVLVSTCNRVEFYVAGDAQNIPRVEDMITFLADYHGIASDSFSDALYSYHDVEAVRHLFRVTSSLDSMVLGETQILGQVKEAFETARGAGTVGKRLGSLFPQAFGVAKDIHTKTMIATGKISVGSTAVDLARQIFANLSDKSIMMVGAGQMGQVTLAHLLAEHPKELWLTSRTADHASALAESLSQTHTMPVHTVDYDQWLSKLADVDIVISSTGSREPILTAEDFAPIPELRRYRSLLLIDIAVPRDIEAEIGQANGVFLFNIDDLQSVVEVNLAQRKEAISQCHQIIEKNVLESIDRQTNPGVGPIIASLEKQFDQISQRELERILPKLEQLNEHDRALLAEMVHRINRKLLHRPISQLNTPAPNGATHVYAETLKRLFDLPADGGETP